MPTLSIIIPTFNSAATIGRCLASIKNQSFNDYEIVVQDGISTDTTLDIVREFQKANNRINVRTECAKDRGVYDAMNRAILRARGTWLYFLGSDDELNDENVLKNAMSPEHAYNNEVLYGNVRVIGDCCWAAHGSIYDGPFDLQKLLIKNISHQAIFYSAELVGRAGSFNLDYAICADWDFNLRCWALTKFKYIDLVVAKFYAGGISTKETDKQFQRGIAVLAVRDFKFSLLSPVLNNPSFFGRPRIVELQKAKGKLYALCGRVIGLPARLVRRWARIRAVPSGLGK